MVFQHPPTPHSVLSEYGLPGCCKCNFDFGPNHPLLLGRGHHAHDTRAREEEQECKTAACAEDVADHADDQAEDDSHRHLSNNKDSKPQPYYTVVLLRIFTCSHSKNRIAFPI